MLHYLKNIVIRLRNVKYAFGFVKGTRQFSIWFENKSSSHSILQVTLLITSANYLWAEWTLCGEEAKWSPMWFALRDITRSHPVSLPLTFPLPGAGLWPSYNSKPCQNFVLSSTLCSGLSATLSSPRIGLLAEMRGERDVSCKRNSRAKVNLLPSLGDVSSVFVDGIYHSGDTLTPKLMVIHHHTHHCSSSGKKLPLEKMRKVFVKQFSKCSFWEQI